MKNEHDLTLDVTRVLHLDVIPAPQKQHTKAIEQTKRFLFIETFEQQIESLIRVSKKLE